MKENKILKLIHVAWRERWSDSQWGINIKNVRLKKEKILNNLLYIKFIEIIKLKVYKYTGNKFVSLFFQVASLKATLKCLFLCLG